MKNVKKSLSFSCESPGTATNMQCNPHVSRVRRLYKLIFRVHRALPPELRVMGNNYARDEFKRHKNCKPEEAMVFLNEWTDYAINLAKQMKPINQAKKKTIGVPLDPALLDHMSDEQIVQLYELHEAAKPDYNSEFVSEDSNDKQHSHNILRKQEIILTGEESGKNSK